MADRKQQSNDKLFSEGEIALLNEGLSRTHKERFMMATRLYKIQQTLQKATIVHKPLIKDK